MKTISTNLNNGNVYQDVNYVIRRRLNRKLKDKVNRNVWMPIFLNVSRIHNDQRFNFKRNT